jgi:hypothetical protein
MSEELQELHDRIYMMNGPCCAGCDWWGSFNSHAGECKAGAPVEGHKRLGLLDITSCSLRIEAGHIFTPRSHHCGDFKDDFDWSSLPKTYLAKIGYREKEQREAE